MKKRWAIVILVVLGFFCCYHGVFAEPSSYTVKDYSALLHIGFFSESMMRDHLNLYRGYVKNVNNISVELFWMLNRGDEKSLEYSELKRRFGWEFNGMRLHEYYFGNLGGHPLPRNTALYKHIVRDFGSFEAWRKDFAATGEMRGTGWAILCRDPKGNRLFNVWVGDHDQNNLVDAKPLVVMDVFEHAYLKDYGLNRKEYIDTFIQNINWEMAMNRY